jgi:hypothetical protein
MKGKGPMSMLSDLPTLDQFAAEVRKKTLEDARSYVKNLRENAKERVERARQTREALQKLEAAGVVLAHCHTTYAYIELGFFPTTKGGNSRLAEAVRRVRLALGCKLDMDGKEVNDAKKRLVTVTLRATNYPSVRVQFERKLPKGAKCRIVRCRTSYTTLVCYV